MSARIQIGKLHKMEKDCITSSILPHTTQPNSPQSIQLHPTAQYQRLASCSSSLLRPSSLRLFSRHVCTCASKRDAIRPRLMLLINFEAALHLTQPIRPTLSGPGSVPTLPNPPAIQITSAPWSRRSFDTGRRMFSVASTWRMSRMP